MYLFDLVLVFKITYFDKIRMLWSIVRIASIYWIVSFKKLTENSI